MYREPLQTVNATSLPNFLIDSPIRFPWYHVHREDFIPGISDKFSSLLANIIAYWTVSLLYHALDTSGWKWLEKYRLHESDEVKAKNTVTKSEVIRSVALQQFMLTSFAYIWLTSFSGPEGFKNHAAELGKLYGSMDKVISALVGHERAREVLQNHGLSLTYAMYWWVIPMYQFFLSLFILDTYEYFLHRLFHEVNFFYKHFHSIHHRLYVPFAFGALYGHLFEGAILDGLGGVLAHTATGMTYRQGIFFFAFVTYKTVDDHCGYYFPWYPTHLLFGNNAQYHDIHHQTAGIKFNYAQPLFVHWDVLLGTRMTVEQLREKKEKTKLKQLKSY